MSEQLNEFLSAAVDGEAQDFELRRVLDEAGRDPELLATWNSYHLISQGLRDELPAQAHEGPKMADAVWEACFAGAEVAAELTTVAPADRAAAGPEPKAQPGRRWGGLAVAAAVATMAVGAVFVVGNQPAATPAGLVATDPAPAEIQIDGPRFQVETTVSPSDVQRANAYMLHHAQQKAMNQPGVASFVKVVTFEAKE
ncbi:MAG: sigma-E factor negative regulatory protein [Pseudomonadota bacterium]